MFGLFGKKDDKHTAQPNKEQLCPYCQVLIDKNPVRKFKCSGCGNQVLVRKHYKTDSYDLFSEDTVKKYDREKEAYYRAKSLIRGLKMSVQDDKKIDKLVKDTQQAMNQKFGFEASLGDVAWSVANKMLVETMKKGDLNMLRFLYFEMGLYLHKTGRDSSTLMQTAFEIDLKNYLKSGVVSEVQVLAIDESCEACKKLHEKQFTIREAIEQKILPCKECTYKLDKSAQFGWCRCCYSPIISLS